MYANKEILDKVKGLYPEIDHFDIGLDATWNESTGTWVLTLEKDGQTLNTHLDLKEADTCFFGENCVHLSSQIGQFVNNYCLDGECRI